MCSGGNATSESAAFLYGGMKSLGRSMLLWARDKTVRCLGPFPTTGNGPRRTRRLRLTPQHGIRHGRIPICCRGKTLPKFCRLTPPADAGSSHRQTAEGGGRYLMSRIGRTNSMILSRISIREHCRVPHCRITAEDRDMEVVFLFPVEKNTNENEFQCQLKNINFFTGKSFLRTPRYSWR